MKEKKDIKINEKISVLMSVYKNDKIEWFKNAISSILNQTYKPDEIVLFVDGPVSNEMNECISNFEKENKIIKIFRNEENIGLGKTLQKGILQCKNEIIARMDSDDFSNPDRLEKELLFLLENDLDLVGSTVDEFSDDINQILQKKIVPLSQKEIYEFSKKRNPFCHPSVMFKKSKVIEAGNYLDMPFCEDYYLWIRMIQKNCKCANIDESLVKMRVNVDMYVRRGGMAVYKAQKQLFKYMYKTKYIGFGTYLKNKMIRFCFQVMMPKSLRKKIYEKQLRNK